MTRAGFGRLATTIAVAGVAAATAFLMTAAAAPGQSASKAGPHIVANPNNLMVNTVTHLTGTGFRPGTTYTVAECSVKTWAVGQHPCDTNNTVNVTADAHGGFKAPLTAEVCPAPGGTGKRGFSEICYVGVPKPDGVDGIRLFAPAKITVTGP